MSSASRALALSLLERLNSSFRLSIFGFVCASAVITVLINSVICNKHVYANLFEILRGVAWKMVMARKYGWACLRLTTSKGYSIIFFFIQ
jgi:hypothetical protein